MMSANLQASQCPSPCPFTGIAAAHHDQLLKVDQDIDQAMALFELAVTWGELEYSQASLIGPSQWSGFVAMHRWPDQGRAEELFSLAVDAASHSVRASLVMVG
jgi:hypothetical protein